MPQVRSFTIALFVLASACGSESTPSTPTPDVPDPPQITTDDLTIGVEDAPYSATLRATDGDGTVSWRLLDGELPPGIDLSSSGALTGIPTRFGSFHLTIEVADERGRTDSRDLTLSVVGTTTVASGQNHSCTLVTSEGVYCWGRNDSGELDAAGPGNEPLPVEVSGTSDLVSVTSGWFGSCGLTATGVASCWGINLAGYLGTGSISDKSPRAQVSGGHIFLKLASYFAHTCGLDVLGSILCWGAGSSGQLGHSTSVSHSPTPVPVASTDRFVDVTVGQGHSCGVTTAGDALCWGSNDRGQLGDGTTTDRNDPVLVAGGHSFDRISAGAGYTCALDQSGQPWCWGGNGNGQLGNGSEDTWSLEPAPAGSLTFSELSSNYAHTCGSVQERVVYCWGWNENGRLGDGTFDDRNEPTGPVALP